MGRKLIENTTSSSKALSTSCRGDRKKSWRAINYDTYKKNINKLMDLAFSEEKITSLTDFFYMCEYVAQNLLFMQKPHGLMWNDLARSGEIEYNGGIHAFLDVDTETYAVTAKIVRDKCIMYEYSINCQRLIRDLGDFDNKPAQIKRRMDTDRIYDYERKDKEYLARLKSVTRDLHELQSEYKKVKDILNQTQTELNYYQQRVMEKDARINSRTTEILNYQTRMLRMREEMDLFDEKLEVIELYSDPRTINIQTYWDVLCSSSAAMRARHTFEESFDNLKDANAKFYRWAAQRIIMKTIGWLINASQQENIEGNNWPSICSAIENNRINSVEMILEFIELYKLLLEKKESMKDLSAAFKTYHDEKQKK